VTGGAMSQSVLRSSFLPLVAAALLSTHTSVARSEDDCPADGEPTKVSSSSYKGPGEKWRGCVGEIPYLIYKPTDWKAGGPLIVSMYGYWPKVMTVSPLILYDLVAGA